MAKLSPVDSWCYNQKNFWFGKRGNEADKGRGGSKRHNNNNNNLTYIALFTKAIQSAYEIQ